MDTEKLNKWLTLIANVGVLAGIVFLALEIRQNNDLLTSQGRAARAELRQAGFVRLIENDDLRRSWVKSQNSEQLTPDEELLVGMFASSILINWQSSWIELDKGLLDIEDISPDGWKTDFQRSPALKELWPEMKYRLRPDFVDWMEEHVVR